MDTAPAKASRPARAFVWMGGGIFALSLLYFLFSYLVTFARPAVAGGAAATAWNVALFTVFALHHSLFAREHVRGWVARRAPAGTERAIFVWSASLLLVAVCALWQPVGGPPLWAPEGAWRWLLGAAQLTGVVLAVGSAAVIGIWELAGIASSAAGAGPAGATPPSIRAVGPYRWVRHPIYTGWFLIVFAAAPMTRTQFVFAVASGVYTLVGIAFEERSLRATTAGGYERYMRTVRWKLVPGVY